MPLDQPRGVSRRSLLGTAAGSAVFVAGVAPAILRPRGARARARTLKILQWHHFVPEYDDWFNNTWVREWGERNDTEVIVDNVGMTSLKGRADAEVAAQEGHDLCMFLAPPAAYEDQVVDLRAVHAECASRYGRPVDLATKSTYNPRTGKYYGFTDSYVPDPVNYRRDLWDDVGVYPDSWDDVRVGGRKILRGHGIPVGIGLAPELDTNMALRSIMAAYGASVQNADGAPALKSPETLEALKFVKALYQEAMTDEVFTWDASSNNRQMLAGKGSLTVNAISITRTGEAQRIPIADRIWLAKAAKGPAGRLGFQHLLDVYVVWKFADNIDGAQQFLIDLVGQSRNVFRASKFYNFPCYPDMVPDLATLIDHDAQAAPTDKYSLFGDVGSWTTNVGHPGYANAAIDQIFNDWIISNMFAEVASGRSRPEDALDRCDHEVRRIFADWHGRGLV